VFGKPLVGQTKPLLKFDHLQQVWRSGAKHILEHGKKPAEHQLDILPHNIFTLN